MIHVLILFVYLNRTRKDVIVPRGTITSWREISHT